MKSVTVQELAIAIKNNLNVIDVRESDEFVIGHVPNAKSIPLSELENRVGEVQNGDYIICRSGVRSARACQFLSSKDLDVVNVLGGVEAWTGEIERD